jgi:hypothetical protein
MKRISEVVEDRLRFEKKKINKFQKSRKILARVRTAPKRIFETFCTQETPRCFCMNATLTTIYLI